jgi:indolepyruvate ferredoxin oxidoreductase
VNLEETMTGAFTRDPDLAFPAEQILGELRRAAGPGGVEALDASRLATALTGDAIGANLLLVGYAWQRGLIPLSRAAIERAIEINGVAVAFNQAAFLWGRRAAHDLDLVVRIAGLGPRRPAAKSLDELIDERATFLGQYQDRAWAERYRATVARIRAAEQRVLPGHADLAEAAARGLFKLMSYKDEYEVARLYTSGAFRRQLEAELESWGRLELHLAPPLIAARDPVTGHLVKRRFGPWILHAFKVLAPLKRLRGTAFDPFGRTAERRMERRLIGEHEALLAELAAGLTPASHAAAVELLATFRAPPPLALAAE